MYILSLTYLRPKAIARAPSRGRRVLSGGIAYVLNGYHRQAKTII